jgi:hypothetical protein
MLRPPGPLQCIFSRFRNVCYAVTIIWEGDTSLKAHQWIQVRYPVRNVADFLGLSTHRYVSLIRSNGGGKRSSGLSDNPD